MASPPHSGNITPFSSKWRRPFLYQSIVAIYLVASCIFLCTYLGYKLYRNFHETQSTPIALPFILLYQVVLSILSIVGAVELFSKHRSLGFPLSALVLNTLIFPFMVGLFWGTLDPSIYSIRWNLIDATFIYGSFTLLPGSMFPLLIIGWKKVGKSLESGRTSD